MNDEELLQHMAEAGKTYPLPPGIGQWREGATVVRPGWKHRIRFTNPLVAIGAPMGALSAITLAGAAVVLLGVTQHHTATPAHGGPSASAVLPQTSASSSSPANGSPQPSGSGAATSSATPRPVTTSPPSGNGHPGQPSSPPSRSVDCITQPSACGFPDATNTGVAGGANLAPVPGTNVPGATWNSGELDVTTAGVTIQNIAINGVLRIEAGNVTVKNVTVSTSGGYFAVVINSGVSGTLIEDATIHGVNGSGQGVQYAVQDSGDSTQMMRLNMYNCWQCVNTSGLLKDSYIHDLAANSSAQDVSGSGSPITIEHNTMLNQQNSEAVVFCSYTHCTVDDNLIAGGSFAIYGGHDTSVAGSGAYVVITNNRFATLYFSQSGSSGYAADFAGTLPGDVWSGNVWDSNSQALSAP